VQLANGARASGLAQAAIDAVTSGRVKITPERYAKGYIDWLSQKRDWCISRQLWWGHRIPVWQFQLAGTEELVKRRTEFMDRVRKFAATEQLQNDIWIVPDQDDELIFWVCARAGRADRFLLAIEEAFYKPAIETLRQPGQPYNRTPPHEKLFEFPKAFQSILEMSTEPVYVIQDPDVLDTWFSSALWPLSTMGWPANGTSDRKEDQLLPYFYPTSLLSTAREILTLWVARMVIFGLYCHGDVPFKDVYIHAIIQDGEGRPMKKTLGNGVDPVDIVKSHGADALRFTLASMATETQDIRMPVVKDSKTGQNTSPKFDLGRNFANKIWNASRYILGAIDEATPSYSPGLARGNLSNLEDRWILSRLNSTIQTVTVSINSYKFADLAEALRSFFWTDLCDWYLEISKARIKSGDETVQQILLHCLETTLKLLHPVMPFITEELWSKLPNRQSMLIATPFPTPDATAKDAAAESQISLIQSVTSQIREIQNRYPAARGKPVILKPRDAATQQLVEQSRTIIEPLAQVTIAENSPTAQKPENAATAILPEAEIYIAGVIDKAIEMPKLQKRRDELNKLATSQRNKLGNEAAVAKVPAHVLQGWRDQLTKYQEELVAIEKNLAELQ
jgi:valyl-tRNA synthetase